MPETVRTVAKSAFMNIDARVRCPTPDCWGDLVLMPTGAADAEGFPAYRDFTACPLCLASFDLEQDVSDRDLFLRVAWLRANPDAMPADEPPPPGQGPD